MDLYKNPNVPAKVRAKDLLSKMTLEEKIAQLGSVWSYELLTEDGKFSVEKAKEILKHGIGQITRPGGATNFEPPEVAKLVNEIQKFLVENTRLGIPAIMHEECLAGYMGLGATIFPQPIGMASTWDPELVEKITSAIREDLRKLGITQGLAPVLDVARDPRWGRTEETFGESPYLVAKMGVAYVKGLQGSDITKGVVATGKHFAGYSASEGGKNWAPTNIPPRELREVFLYPFEAAVKEAGLLSIMNSYSEIDGIPCASNRELLTDILRRTWGFEGIVVSDYFAVDMLAAYHRMAKNKAEAAKYALEAGIDIELPKTDCYLHLKSLVENGIISEKLLDEAVLRVLTLKFLLGLFENPYAEGGSLNDHNDIALEASRKSIVLLKNNGILPLKNDVKIALVGPTANDVRNLLGDYSYLVHIKTLLENVNATTFNAPKFNLKKVEELVEAHLKKIPSILAEFAKRAKEIYYAKGCDITDPSREGFAEALEAAKKADVVVAVVGDRSGLTIECTSGESRDMANLKLPGVQEEFILELTKVGKPIVVVLVTGRPYSLKAFVNKVNAIVQLWLPGETGAQALAEVIFGQVNPSGKLPISFPASAGQIPVFHYVKPSGGRSCWHGNYVDEDVKPLFPFGHGLSYTTFSYTNLRIEQQEIPIAGSVKLKVDVQNTGEIYGEEVVQLYISREHASVTRPVKELKGFARVKLQPKETKTVVFEIHTDVLAYYDRDMKLVVEPGEYKVLIGSSAEDIRCQGNFKVVGEKRLVQDNRVFFTNTKIE
ncbi:glycoside hydrolase family 3 N-terminal domain-containing protein [Pseudothermotoga thermarum]|uniref:Glycoside hydrolase family 3 domain protein n=1 Tax=Pseudothermotoga thermarum DSM 5069 TaxID=688269 RepID=F7YUQ7_9THEM|nr:glycoside hydrolase family 3 N-terminal domain-containing protein [Pseudothermotoga thermarum]AEH50242.1 glycoside hydrolase family 3 domain protein [Pseudothermotoga thermarum DSM 5069]